MNEHKNIITIEDEIKEFSDKPVKSSAIHKTLGALEQAMAQALEEKGVPDSSEASVGDVLTKGEGGVEWATPSGGLPDPSEASVGDVLTKGEDGIEWETPSGGGGDTGVDLNIVVDCTATVASGGNYQLTGASLSVPFDDLKTACQNHKVIRGIVKVTVSTEYSPIYGDYDIGYVALENGYYYLYFSKVTGVVSTQVTITCGNVILKNTGGFQNGNVYVSKNIALS